MALVAPALLSADFARLGEALGIIKAAGASMVHVDVMDGHFTPDLTVGQPVIRSLRRATDLALETAESVLERFSFLKSYFSQPATTPFPCENMNAHLMLECQPLLPIRSGQVKAYSSLTQA